MGRTWSSRQLLPRRNRYRALCTLPCLGVFFFSSANVYTTYVTVDNIRYDAKIAHIISTERRGMYTRLVDTAYDVTRFKHVMAVKLSSRNIRKPYVSAVRTKRNVEIAEERTDRRGAIYNGPSSQCDDTEKKKKQRSVRVLYFSSMTVSLDAAVHRTPPLNFTSTRLVPSLLSGRLIHHRDHRSLSAVFQDTDVSSAAWAVCVRFFSSAAYIDRVPRDVLHDPRRLLRPLFRVVAHQWRVCDDRPEYVVILLRHVILATKSANGFCTPPVAMRPRLTRRAALDHLSGNSLNTDSNFDLNRLNSTFLSLESTRSTVDTVTLCRYYGLYLNHVAFS